MSRAYPNSKEEIREHGSFLSYINYSNTCDIDLTFWFQGLQAYKVTREMCFALVRRSPYFFYSVRRDMKDLELCKLAVGLSTANLRWVPMKYRTKELCDLVYKENSRAIKYIPKEFITKKRAAHAVRDVQSNINFIPHKYIDYDIMMSAIKQKGPYSIFALYDIPKDLVTVDIVKAHMAIHKDVKPHCLGKELTLKILNLPTLYLPTLYQASP